jgi:hypothetical protein
METIGSALKSLKQHIKALGVIVSAGEITDPFALHETLSSIYKTFLNKGFLASDGGLHSEQHSMAQHDLLWSPFQGPDGQLLCCCSLQSPKFLTAALDLELYSLLRKVHGLINVALDVIRAEIRTNPIARRQVSTQPISIP